MLLILHTVSYYSNCTVGTTRSSQGQWKVLHRYRHKEKGLVSSLKRNLILLLCETGAYQVLIIDKYAQKKNQKESEFSTEWSVRYFENNLRVLLLHPYL